MKTKTVHPQIAQAARKFAREELHIRHPKLRPATAAELTRTTLKGKNGLHTETITDAVVVKNADGKEWLLHVADANPELSKKLHAESAALTMVGLVPLLGPFIAGGLAVYHVIKSSLQMVKDKATKGHVMPEHRAMLQTGLKHLGLCGLSLGTAGTAHHVAAAVELAQAGTNISQQKTACPKSILKAMGMGLQSAAGVGHHHHGACSVEDIRIVVFETPEQRPKVASK